MEFLRFWMQSTRSPEEVFSEIYKNHLWGGADGEMYSGSGSRFAPADLYVQIVTKFIKEHEISTVVDLGCGDFEIGRKLAAECKSYIGIDVVPELIARNRRLFESKSIRFVCADVTKAVLPESELCLVRQVFQHMSNEQILSVLRKLRKYRYVIVTEHQPDVPTVYNKDKAHGAGIRFDLGSGVYLEKPPFNVSEVKLLLETRPMVLGPGNQPIERQDWGLLRTFLVNN
jgi:SAM-dependent methyltransferase